MSRSASLTVATLPSSVSATRFRRLPTAVKRRGASGKNGIRRGAVTGQGAIEAALRNAAKACIPQPTVSFVSTECPTVGTRTSEAPASPAATPLVVSYGVRRSSAPESTSARTPPAEPVTGGEAGVLGQARQAGMRTFAATVSFDEKGLKALLGSVATTLVAPP